MTKAIKLILLMMLTACSAPSNENVDKVIATKGLVAFWDFKNADDQSLVSYYENETIDKSFPLYLRQIGDQNRYATVSWPYTDQTSKIVIDQSGPFGHALRFNKGYIYGEVPRSAFDGSDLDLAGKKPFTMIAWVRFDGNRHMVAGIWDEGGWNKYAGRRQTALFAGLFNQEGVIAHVSSTGAASYPQSSVDGAQYARIRAIDGQAFDNEIWVAIAMTFDPEKGIVQAYLNGEMTEYTISDPVTEDVMHNAVLPSSNPFIFTQPLYGARAFQLKYNGFDFHNGSIKEHRLWIDLEKQNVEYSQIGSDKDKTFRIGLDILRDDKSILINPLLQNVSAEKIISISLREEVNNGDRIIATLEELNNGSWVKVGSDVEKVISEGAPFTFGRALGLDENGLDHGSAELYIDGVAVYNRVLSPSELKDLSFTIKP
jgi:hypothetical protein